MKAFETPITANNVFEFALWLWEKKNINIHVGIYPEMLDWLKRVAVALDRVGAAHQTTLNYRDLKGDNLGRRISDSKHVIMDLGASRSGLSVPIPAISRMLDVAAHRIERLL
jgi:hypothetical protein